MVLKRYSFHEFYLADENEKQIQKVKLNFDCCFFFFKKCDFKRGSKRLYVIYSDFLFVTFMSFESVDTICLQKNTVVYFFFIVLFCFRSFFFI